jgi:4'-phosphopantetheinyl transferase
MSMKSLTQTEGQSPRGTEPVCCEWQSPPDALYLAPGEVHLWLAILEVSDVVFSRVCGSLSDDEKKRAHQIRNLGDRCRYAVACGVLRDLLSRYLLCSPESVKFSYNKSGRPELGGRMASSDVYFNTSRAGCLASYAVVRGHRVGVALEKMQSRLADHHIAENFFSPLEARAVRRSLSLGQLDSFYNAWTRREAYVKAHGEDLGVSGHSLEFSLDPGRTDQVVDCEAVLWTIRAFHPAPGYMMTVAMEGEHCQPKFWRWNASEGSGNPGRAGLVLGVEPDAEGRVEE